ncbi:DUF6199 family natural product biosynthesis protein [Paenibacillus sp. UNC496MF]|uniref:DUF6199 family natural product biosynthesis protein n=1 Tax=Paenibacillus sp. UNC496MF TaxID=1502753 RepID=UPI001C42EE81|nr:DUF6199 family natural product biosynthesis protein [Paenibacillus sp. UNC496MF]
MVPPEVKVISVFLTIFLVLWTGAALFATIKPKTFWNITQGWKATREPSPAYFLFSRIGTAICACIGLVLLIQPYLH